MQDTFSFVASTASQSKVSNSSGHRLGSDTSKAVRRLFATRGDLLQARHGDLAVHTWRSWVELDGPGWVERGWVEKTYVVATGALVA